MKKKKATDRESNWNIKTHSRSEVDAIRLPAHTSHDSSFSCNSSRLVRTGLSGNCNGNSNGKRYYVTWQSTPALSSEQSTKRSWDRNDDRTQSMQGRKKCWKNKYLNIFKLVKPPWLRWTNSLKFDKRSLCEPSSLWIFFSLLGVEHALLFNTVPMSIMYCQNHISTQHCRTDGCATILSI